MLITNNSQQYVTTKFAAKMLKLSVATVQKLVEKEELTAWKTDGGHRRVLLSSINDYLIKKNMGDDSNKNLKVFIVEDDQPSALLYSKTIKTWNLPLEVEICESGIECVHLLSKKKPDLIITDIKMERMDGVELVKFLKTSSEYQDIYIIVVTGLEGDSLLRLIPFNITLLHKPIPFYELKGFISAMCSMKKSNHLSLI